MLLQERVPKELCARLAFLRRKEQSLQVDEFDASLFKLTRVVVESSWVCLPTALAHSTQDPTIIQNSLPNSLSYNFTYLHFPSCTRFSTALIRRSFTSLIKYITSPNCVGNKQRPNSASSFFNQPFLERRSQPPLLSRLPLSTAFSPSSIHGMCVLQHTTSDEITFSGPSARNAQAIHVLEQGLGKATHPKMSR